LQMFRSDIKHESFLEYHTWTRLIKIGDWVYDQGDKRIIGGGINHYLLSRETYGNASFSLTATLAFSNFEQHLEKRLDQMNAGIILGWNSDNANPMYYNLLITGKRILLEKIGFNGGDAYRDFHHISEGEICRIMENHTYEFSISCSSQFLDVFLDQQLYCSFKRPENIIGRIGLRPWRSQIHCSRFTISEITSTE